VVVETLERIGPCMSSVLTRHLTGPGVTAETARKRLSRAIAVGVVSAVDGLNFTHNAKFVYLPQQKKKLDFARNLKDAIVGAGGAYARAILAVQGRRVVPKWQFPIVCGAPLQRRKHLTPTQVLDRLRDAGVFVEQDVPGLGSVIAMADRAQSIPPADIAAAVARQTGESLLLDMVRDWSRRLGISTWDAVRVRKPKGPLPEVGSYAWDIASPSYLLPLAQWGKSGKKPGFFACDVLGGTIQEHAASVFRHKCEELRYLNVAPVLALFVADSYQKKAFDDLKAAGIIPATIRSLFGKDAAEAFQDLAGVLTGALKGSLDTPVLADVVRRLTKIEGARGNLQGALFEYLVAEVIRHQQPHMRLEMNKHIKDRSGKDVEIDVWGFDRPHPLRFVECKGREPGSEVADGEIDLWLDRRIPAIRDYLARHAVLEGATTARPAFELWLIGRLSEASAKRIEKTREANKRVFDLVVVHADGVLSAANATGNSALVDTLELLFKDTPG
jgi:hypothetical protein